MANKAHTGFQAIYAGIHSYGVYRDIISLLALCLTLNCYSTVEPLYNEVLGTMKITLLYQGKKNKEI